MLKKDSNLTRINNFFVRNWWLNGISNIVIIFLFFYFFNELADFKEDFKSRLNKAMENVIFATPDGRVGLLDKHLIETDNKVFQNHIALIVKNMEASESLLTQGFDKAIASKIKQPSSLLDVNENFRLLYKEYFSNNATTMSFLRYYYNLLKMGHLAKKNEILGTQFKYISMGKSKFRMKITFKTLKVFINKISNKSSEIIVNDTFFVDGYIDPTKYSSSLNPYGVKFTKITINVYTYTDYENRINGRR